ncbi:MAG: capsule assembly Wzi family protein, partial [Gemmatimonadaceae bacterium]
YPWGFNDGAIWQGKGANVAATLGFGARWRMISLRVEPVIFRAQNGDFQLLGDTTRGANAFVDQQRPYSIDLPQRFGRTPYQRVDPGQSELRVDAGPVAVGVSTMNNFWGPGIRHSLMLGGNSAGFPHLFFGTSQAFKTRIGRFSAQAIYGKLSESGFAPGAPTSDRFGSGVVASWQPPSGRGFEIGLSRFYHREWPAAGLRLGDLTVPFGSLFQDLQSTKGGAADNQLASVYARWRAEEAGFELFGEFGRNDRSADGRDLALEPDHNSAWLLGFAKTFAPQGGELWMLRGEYLNGRITALQRLGRGQATFYEHSPITQGHTERGQLLGSPLLERSNGLELGVDRWATWGRAGVTLMQRAMPIDLSDSQGALTARSQWYTEANGVRFIGRHEVFARAGMVWDVNRRPGTDETNLYLQVGARYGW